MNAADPPGAALRVGQGVLMSSAFTLIATALAMIGVMLALLMPFQKPLGLDVQFISGGVYRNVRRGQNPFSGGAHGWLQITYRPSMELRIVDRTWQQNDHPADRAYSRWGDRYPAGHHWGMKPKPVTDSDVNMKISTETFDRQFGEQGRDGRDNHMSNHQ